VALTQNLAAAHAGENIRVNTILPGLMNTPMAIEARVAQGRPLEEVIASRDERIPLVRKMGTGWDEAQFITGVSLPVDGGEWVSYGG